MMRHIAGPFLPLLCLLAATVRPLIGQTARTLVVLRHPEVQQIATNPDHTVSLPGNPGYVVLLDRDGSEVGRALHNSSGLLVIEAPRPGTYRLRSERVGFHSTTSASFRLNAGDVVDMVAQLATQPVRLDTLPLDIAARCDAAPDADLGIGLVWTEIRKALMAAQWPGGRHHNEYSAMQYERVLNTQERVVSETVSNRVGPLVLTNQLDRRISDEYALVRDSSLMSLLSAGGTALLDYPRRNDYCIVLTRQHDRLALRLHPQGDPSSTSDIDATFWIDASSAELQSFEFRLLDAPHDVNRQAGGRVRFMRTDSGRWVVTDWYTRMLDVRREGRTDRWFGYRDLGGTATWIAGPAGGVVHRASFTELHGSIVDVRSVPLRAATVQLVGTDYVTQTDERGEFVLQGPFRGVYDVTYRHPRLDSLNFTPQPVTATLDEGRPDTIAIVMPSFDAMAEGVCVNEPLLPGQRAVAGVIRDAGTEVEVASGRVIARITTESEKGLEHEERILRSGPSGFYSVCGIPLHSQITITAEQDHRISGSVMLTFHEDGLTRSETSSLGERGEPEFYGFDRSTWIEDLQISVVRRPPPPTRIGIKFGRTITTVVGTSINAERKTGFQIAGFYEVQLGKRVALHAEGQFVQQGAESLDDARVLELNYVRFPVLMKLRLADTSRVVAPHLLVGPTVGFETRGKRGVPKGDIGVVLGGGIGVGKGTVSLLLAADYTIGLTNISPPFLVEPTPGQLHVPEFFDGQSFRNRVLSLSLGLSFRLNKGPGLRGPRRPRTTPRGRDLIARADIVATNAATAFEVVQQLRPEWLRLRGRVSIETEEEGIVVYVDNTRRGNVNQLRSITIDTVTEIRFLSGSDATMRFGSGHGRGVIQVITGR
jgi:hypothetical protein